MIYGKCLDIIDGIRDELSLTGNLSDSINKELYKLSLMFQCLDSRMLFTDRDWTYKHGIKLTKLIKAYRWMGFYLVPSADEPNGYHVLGSSIINQRDLLFFVEIQDMKLIQDRYDAIENSSMDEYTKKFSTLYLKIHYDQRSVIESDIDDVRSIVDKYGTIASKLLLTKYMMSFDTSYNDGLKYANDVAEEYSGHNNIYARILCDIGCMIGYQHKADAVLMDHAKELIVRSYQYNQHDPITIYHMDVLSYINKDYQSAIKFSEEIMYNKFVDEFHDNIRMYAGYSHEELKNYWKSLRCFDEVKTQEGLFCTSRLEYLLDESH